MTTRTPPPRLVPDRPSLTERLQQKCSDWGTYWRAPDAHGVILSREQALELLRDALLVEVEIDAAAPPAEAPTFLQEAIARLAAAVDAPNGSTVTITKADACAIGQRLAALAGAAPNIGVGVDVSSDGVDVTVVLRDGAVDTVIHHEHHDLPHAPAKAREDWQPIATAPKDGSYILLANYGQEADEGRWLDGSRNHWGEAGWYFADGDVLCDHPTHPDVWRPKLIAPAALATFAEGERRP